MSQDAPRLPRLSEAEIAKIERKLDCVMPEASRETLRDLGFLGWFLDGFQRNIRNGVFEVADDLIKHSGSLERAIGRMQSEPGIWLALGGLGELTMKLEELEQLQQRLHLLREAARRIQAQKRKSGRGTQPNAARMVVIEFLCLAYQGTSRANPEPPSVARFARAVWPHLHHPTACKSADALADALNKAMVLRRCC